MNNNTIDETKCNICKRGYANPKLLQCFHVFCCECLHTSFDSQNETLTCETCNETFKMTREDIDKLPEHMPFKIITNLQNSIEKLTEDPNSLICTDCTFRDIEARSDKAYSYCIQCQTFFCDFDSSSHQKYNEHAMVPIEDFTYRPIFSQLPQTPEIYCKEHKEVEIKAYCAQCETACCEHCAKFYHIHHDVENVQDAEDSLVKKIEDNFQTVKDMTSEVSSKLSDYQDQKEQIIKSKENTISKVRNVFEGLHEKIERRQEECEKRVSEIYDEQFKIVDDLVESMSSFESKINYAETHFELSIKLFPKYYLYSLSDSINTRLASIKNSVPKKLLKASTIDFTIPDLELKAFESKIATIGTTSRNTVTDFSNSKVLTTSDLGLNSDATVHCFTQEENKLSILMSESGNDSDKTKKIHVIDQSLRSLESVQQSASLEAPTQMAKMASGTVLITDSNSRNVVVLNRDEPKRILEIEDTFPFTEPASISVVKQGEEKDHVAVYDNRTGHVGVLNKDLEILRRIPVKETVVRRQRKSSSSSLSSAGSSRSNSRADSRMSDFSTNDSAFLGSGRSSQRSRTSSPASINSAVNKIKEKPSQILATNSKNEIIVADEDDASYSIYSLTGSKLNTIGYKKHLGEKGRIVRSNSNTLKPNVTTINSNLKRTNSAKRVRSPLENSSSGRSSPNSSRERTLITTDKLDNVYVCRNKQILTFNASNTFLKRDKLPENIDPISFLVNPFGEAYILSSNGQLHLFETL